METYWKKVYRERKESGLCTKCGKRQSKDGCVLCEECSARENKHRMQDRSFFLKIGICPVCKKNKIFGDEKACPECKAKSAQAREEFNLRHDGYNRKYQQERRKALRNLGLCVDCKEPAKPGRVRCEKCLEKARMRAKAIKAKKGGISRFERASYGECYICGAPIEQGQRICKKCKDRQTALLQSEKAIAARERVKEEKRGFYIY